jgi:hypothetical protein
MIKMDGIIKNNKIIQVNPMYKEELLSYLSNNKIKYLYMTDFSMENSINICDFINKYDDMIVNEKMLSIFNISGSQYKKNYSRNLFNNFIKNKIFVENFNLIVYEFNCNNSINFVSDIFLNTRVYGIKTILIHQYKIPPGLRTNLDVVLD